MESIQSFLTQLGERVTGLILDPGCVTGIIVIIIFVYAIVNIIWMIVERWRRKRFTQSRQNGEAGFNSPVQNHEWERDRQPESRRSAEPAPPVKSQLRWYIRERIKKLLQ